MGSHDPAAMASPRLVQTFAHLIDVERELRELLDERLERDMRLLSTSGTRAS
jgi:hypothetical protein